MQARMGRGGMEARPSSRLEEGLVDLLVPAANAEVSPHSPLAIASAGRSRLTILRGTLAQTDPTIDVAAWQALCAPYGVGAASRHPRTRTLVSPRFRSDLIRAGHGRSLCSLPGPGSGSARRAQVPVYPGFDGSLGNASLWQGGCVGPEDIDVKNAMTTRAAANNYHAAGCSGIYAFNWHSDGEDFRRALLEVVGDPKTLRGADKVYAAAHRVVVNHGFFNGGAAPLPPLFFPCLPSPPPSPYCSCFAAPVPFCMRAQPAHTPPPLTWPDRPRGPACAAY